jgi:hypothetical protein
MAKKIILNGRVDQTKISTGHRAHRSGSGVHRNKSLKRNASRLRRELNNEV